MSVNWCFSGRFLVVCGFRHCFHFEKVSSNLEFCQDWGGACLSGLGGGWSGLSGFGGQICQDWVVRFVRIGGSGLS